MSASRICPSCGVRTEVSVGERIWPQSECWKCNAIILSRNEISQLAPELDDTKTGLDPLLFDKLVQFEQDHFWFTVRNELIVRIATKYFPHAKAYLEIGCGNGYVLNAMQASREWDRIVGSELHTSGLVHAKRRMPTGVEFVQMDARNIPAENMFDLTGAFDVLEHIPDDVSVLHGLRKSMIRGGGILITVPQHPWLWSPADDAAFHQRRYRPNELESKLTGSGFEIVFSSSFTSLLLPLMATSRLMDNLRKHKYHFGREFEISRPLNAVLRAILRAEIGATIRGVRWPIGGSRLVVAKAL